MKTIIDVLHCERKRNDRTKEKDDRTINNEQHKHVLKLFMYYCTFDRSLFKQQHISFFII